MTTTTTAELAALSGTDLTTLPPAARAAVALKSEQTRKDLALLVEQSAGITAVLNADGREQAHRVAMTLKGARVTIEKTGKEVRDDATKFSKAVIAEEKDLIAIIEPEEVRILALRDAWDARIAAEKAAKIAAERARVEVIQGRIEAIRRAPLAVAGESSTAILVTLELVRDAIIDDSFEELKDQAMAARSEAFNALEAAHARAVEAEVAARAAEDARKAEAARIEAERAELARLRAEAAERERLAKADADRVAAEQAEVARQLAEQQAELQRQREAESARARAEQEERDRAAADAQRRLAEQAAELAEQRAAFARQQLEAAERAQAAAQVERDHAEGLPMNAQFDADREAERVRLQELADQAAADARERADDERATGLPAGALGADALADVDEGPDDNEIIMLVCEVYGMTFAAAVDRLAAIDFDAVRKAQP
jgi:hypothetical protein